MRSSRFLLIALFLGMGSMAEVCVHDFAVLGAKGQLFICGEGEIPSCTKKIDWLPSYMSIDGSFFHEENGVLFVSDSGGRKYQLDLDEENPEYRLINADFNTSSSIVFDPNGSQPAWLRLGSNPQSSQWYAKENEEEVIVVSPSNLLSDHFPMHPTYLPDGLLTSEELLRKDPSSQGLLVAFPGDEWVIHGRSRTIQCYSRVIAHITKLGEPYRATLLFQDRETSRWKSFQLDQAVRAYVYDGVALLRGRTIVNDGKKAKPDVPSGTWYFYFPGADELVVADLGPVTNREPWMEVLYATSTTAYIAKGPEVYLMDISPQGAGEPRKVLTVPDGVVPFRIYPLP